MKSALRIVLILSVLLLTSCGTGDAETPPDATAEGTGQTEQVLALDWIIDGQHSPFFVALDKGYYAENGMAVTIVRGYGSGDTVRRVAAQQADFGFADTGPLISARKVWT